MIDNPRFRGMTLPQARKIEEESEGFRDLSDEQVWALRMVHAHDCAKRPAEPNREAALHDAYYEGAGASERSYDAWAQRRGFNSSGELHAWVDAHLAERPPEPDPELVDDRDRAERWADALAAALAPPEVLGEHSSTNNPWKNALDYAGRPAEPAPDDPHGSVGLDRSTHELIATCKCGASEVFPIGGDGEARAWLESHRAALADSDLVAAFMATELLIYKESWRKPLPTEAEAMAAVAQARIDAAVNAERDRIRGRLRDLRDDSGGVITAHHAIAAVDRDTGGQQ